MRGLGGRVTFHRIIEVIHGLFRGIGAYIWMGVRLSSPDFFDFKSICMPT